MHRIFDVFIFPLILVVFFFFDGTPLKHVNIAEFNLFTVHRLRNIKIEFFHLHLNMKHLLFYAFDFIQNQLISFKKSTKLNIDTSRT